jgi:hypothetical protein
MNQYVWKVTSLETLPTPIAPINNFAVLAKYTVTATSDTKSPITVSFDGLSQFSIPSEGDLTPYADLTEKQVLSWIQSEPNLVINIQANLDGQINSILNPPIAPSETPLPWATTSLKGNK